MPFKFNPVTGNLDYYATFTQVNSDWNAVSGVAEILNKPIIPAAQVNSDWNAVSGVAEIFNKPTLAAIATSGSASDLSSGTTAVARGGTGTGTTPTNGQLLIGNGTGYNLANLTAGANIGITNAAGTITIASTAPVYDYLSDWNSPNNYIGRAPQGSLQSASVWTVRKLTVTSGGAISFYGTAVNIKWTDRYTAVYT